MFRAATDVYIQGPAQDGPVETTPLIRGVPPKNKGGAAYPLYDSHAEEYRSILEGEMILTYTPPNSAQGMGAYTTSCFNGFDVIKKPNTPQHLKMRLTEMAHRHFAFTGFALYKVTSKDQGSAIRCGMITTRNNSGDTLHIGQPVCWRCEDPQKIGNGKARPQIVTQSNMRLMIEQYENAGGVIDPLLREAMLTPFGQVMNTAPNGKDVKILLYV